MKEQEIRDWCVAGDDSIVGNVYNRPGHADGETIITSPVVHVRLEGDARIPMAVTESGSSYWLGTPSRRFGLEQAEAFVWRMSSPVRAVGIPRPPFSPTILQGLPAGGEGSGSGARLAVTCDGCGAVAVTTLADALSSVNAARGISIDDPCPACGGHLAARAGKYRLNDATGMLARIGDFGEPSPAGTDAPNKGRPPPLRTVR